MFTYLFLIVGICLVGFGLKFGMAGWLPIWFGLSFLMVSTAYLGLGAKVFGKTVEGKIALWSLFLLLPYRLINLAFWQIQRLIIKEICCHEIAPGIWLGRRAFAHELPSDISLIVDLTAEFIEPRGVTTGKTYICLPTLDAFIPSDEEFIQLINKVSAWEGNIYLHCALGHGRAATVAAAILIAKEVAKDVEEAEQILKQLRSGVSLSPRQRLLLRRFMSHSKLTIPV